MLSSAISSPPLSAFSSMLRTIELLSAPEIACVKVCAVRVSKGVVPTPSRSASSARSALNPPVPRNSTTLVSEPPSRAALTLTQSVLVSSPPLLPPKSPEK